MSIQDLRAVVKAKDKFAIAAKPEAEALALLQDGYQADLDSARAFVSWIKQEGAPSEPRSSAPRNVPLETWHRRGDVEAGTEDLLSDPESEKARSSRPAGKSKRKG
jgi:hypothetical protein